MRPDRQAALRTAFAGLLWTWLGLGLTLPSSAGADDFAPVLAGHRLAFPEDTGAHPAYRTEWWYITGWLTDDQGRERGFQVTFFRVGTGLGAGILFDNRLCIGANCGAGEFGMVAYRDSNYEHYCSGQFFTGVKGIAGEELFERAVRGDRAAMEIFEEFGRHLGEAVKMIMYTVDPEIIVLGGSVSRALRFFQEPVWEALDDFAYPQSIKKLRIEASELEHVGVLGAAALFYEADEL